MTVRAAVAALAPRRVSLPVDGVRLYLWRAVAIFRLVGLVICLVLIVHWQSVYARPNIALLASAGMAVVSAVVVTLALNGWAHRLWLIGLDVLATAGLTLLTLAAQTLPQQHGGMVTLTTIWAAGPTIEAAFLAGPLGGLLAGAVQLAVATIVRGGYDGNTLYSGGLLIITGGVVGLVAVYTARAEDDLRVAAAAQAAVAERERLARSIHDGALQVLGLVHRTGRDEGGRWSTLATAAAEQEAALRGLITSRPTLGASPTVRDLADDLRGLRSGQVTVSTPGDPVPLPATAAQELGDAVRAALHNVATHAGDAAHAWVLLETLEDEVRVTVRDDGVGFAEGRLDEAADEGRVGVARSVRGRVADLGGRCSITSAPGQGTEIEIVVPW